MAKNGPIYHSSDYGSTWSESYDNHLNYKSISTSRSGRYVFAAVQGGLIYSSSDYGNNWIQTIEILSYWNDIIVVNEGITFYLPYTL